MATVKRGISLLGILLLLAGLCHGYRNQPPYFTNTWNWKIKETDPIGSSPVSGLLFGSSDMIMLKAFDNEGQRLRFRVKGGMGRKYFTVDEDTGVVKVQKQFDYEVDSKYTAKFTVSDGEHTVEGEARITVIDANDNAPLFEKYPYYLEVPENAEIGRAIGRVLATDPDTGDGGEVSYFFTSDYNGPFSIDRDSGIINIREPLDYEQTQAYSFHVIAKDNDRQSPLSSSVQVIVKVQDIQDTDPIFRNLPYDVTIQENIPRGTEVACIKAEDGDMGAPNRVVYSIVNGNEQGDFLLDSASGKVRVARTIDRDVDGFTGVYHLSVKATELSTQGRRNSAFSETSFTVTVVDEDDQMPTWNWQVFRTSLSENSAIGTRLGITMHVKDRDQGINSEMTLAVDNEHARYFSPAPSLLQGSADVSIVLIKSLDYELKKSMKFKVFANESINPERSAVCEVIVDVINVNDEQPVFEQAVYTVDVMENVTLDTTVLQVRAVDGDEGIFGKVTYSMDDKARKFDIDGKTGEIFVIGNLDGEGVFQYSIPVTANDGGSPPYSTTAIVIIQVNDVNDNAPVFESKTYFISVRENNVPREALKIIRASDADISDTNNVISYSIEHALFGKHFSVEKAETGEGVVYLHVPLDYESIPDGRIELEIWARDNGERPLNSSASLVVTVQDENDNAPIFQSDSTFDIPVKEDVASGVTVGKIVARDRDVGMNAKINYIAKDDNFEQVFRIDPQNGDIIVKPGASLDYETKYFYDVIVTAMDYGSPPRMTDHRLIIRIIDVNDNAPIFNQTVYEVDVLEGVTGHMTRVVASDKDSGDFGEIIYEFLQGNNDNTFSINKTTGDISAIKPLDYESTNGAYTVTVVASDSPAKRENEHRTNVQVVINVIDVNDNVPVFVGDVASGRYSVVEGVDGSIVTRMTAVDRDSGENGKVWFAITKANEGNLFEISHTDGILKVRKGITLDREDTPQHNLTVMVSDKGEKPFNSTINIVIDVIDINDNSPEFELCESVITIAENASTGIVATLRATDADLGDFGNVRYKISSGNDDETFTIDSLSGDFMLSKPLDRETKSKYELQVTAYDNPGSSQNDMRMTNKLLTIVVEDINDEPPQFVGVTPYRFKITENSATGTKLKPSGDPIGAIDNDEGENAKISFFITRDDSALFAINSKTGELSTRTDIDRESLINDVTRIDLRVSDSSGRYSDAVAVIKVEDVNDNNPQFSANEYNIRISEDIEPGSVIRQLTATDTDLGANGRVSYRLQKGASDTFSLEPTTGVLRLAAGKELDREQTAHYEIRVMAYDHGEAISLTNSALVNIYVDDVNDSPPKFEYKRIQKEIRENLLVGTPIERIIAQDDDKSADIRYAITSFAAYNDDGREMIGSTYKNSVRKRSSDYYAIKSWFHLNSTTGEIRISSFDDKAKRAVDREICSMVEFEVIARDVASDVEDAIQSTDSLIVQIRIIDENDNAPRFIQPSPNGNEEIGDEIIMDISEEMVIGSILTTLNVHDPDIGTNGKVIFDVLDGRKVKLREKDSGVLLVESRIDRESMELEGDSAWMNITILARDLGFPVSKSSKLRLNMRVLDINDNGPKFDEKFYQLSILENVTVGSEIGLVTATDADSGQYGDITYRLKGGRDKFQIHPKTGSVRVTNEIDHELTPELSFIVTAIDNERGAEADRREATTQVVVVVGDVNDNKPEFYEPESQTTFTIQENAGPGTFVTAVAARDPDVGASAEITYSLQRSRLSSFFQINPTSGHISVRRKLSLLKRPLLDNTLIVYATDGGGLQSNITLLLNIADVNDHAPQFFGKNWTYSEVVEESPGGTFVTQLHAYDEDEELNGMVRYSFCDINVASDARPFFIDEMTGRIITSQKLDREAQPLYTIRACASDLGHPRLQNMTTITVHVKDINDNRPMFKQSTGKGAEQVIRIAEDASVRGVIGQINRATDDDEGGNAQIYYHLVAVSGIDAKKYLNTFAVRPRTGEIVLRSPLNREEKEQHVLIIGATNNGNVTITLPVTSQFQFPVGLYSWDDPNFFQIQKQENKTVGMLMASLRYNDVLPLPEQPIDRSTVTFEPSRDTSLLRLVIDVSDVNDEWPKFKKDKYVTAVDVGVKPGTLITTVKAIDLDDGVNGIVSYRITRTMFNSYDKVSHRLFTDIFEIDPRDGTLYNIRELKSFYDGYFVLDIEASDNAKHTTLASLYIYSLHTNEKVRFVVDTPLNIVKDKKETLIEVLNNITGYLVVIDKILYDVSVDGTQDHDKTDVTIRAFDVFTMSEVVKEKLSEKLEENKQIIYRLFGDYNIKSIAQAWNDNRGNGDTSMLHALIIALISIILILLVLFLTLYMQLRRRYRRKIAQLKAIEYNDETLSSRGPRDSYWKGKMFRALRHKTSHDDIIHEEYSEPDDYTSKYPVPAARKINQNTSGSSTDVTPIVKLRSRSENDQLQHERGMPRTSTDIWVPRDGNRGYHGGPRKTRDQQRQRHGNGKRTRRSGTQSSYYPSSEGGEESTTNISDVSSRAPERPTSLTKENRISNFIQHTKDDHPSDMNLHSGGNSGPTDRKKNITTGLVGSDPSDIQSPRDDRMSSTSSHNMLCDL